MITTYFLVACLHIGEGESSQWPEKLIIFHCSKGRKRREVQPLAPFRSAGMEFRSERGEKKRGVKFGGWADEHNTKKKIAGCFPAVSGGERGGSPAPDMLRIRLRGFRCMPFRMRKKGERGGEKKGGGRIEEGGVLRTACKVDQRVELDWGGGGGGGGRGKGRNIAKFNSYLPSQNGRGGRFPLYRMHSIHRMLPTVYGKRINSLLNSGQREGEKKRGYFSFLVLPKGEGGTLFLLPLLLWGPQTKSKRERKPFPLLFFITGHNPLRRSEEGKSCSPQSLSCFPSLKLGANVGL